VNEALRGAEGAQPGPGDLVLSKGGRQIYRVMPTGEWRKVDYLELSPSEKVVVDRMEQERDERASRRAWRTGRAPNV